MLSVAGPGSSGSVGSDRSCGFVLTGCGFGWLGGDGFIAGRRRCGRTIAALLQATARDGRRKLRTACAFEHLLGQFAELLQRRPRCGIFGREVVAGAARVAILLRQTRSEEHTSELQSLMRISYAVFCLKKNNTLTK